MGFSEQIKNFAMKCETLTTNVYRNSCKQVSMDIAEESPVSTGKLLGQWAPSKNAPSSYFFEGGISAWLSGTKDKGIADANRSTTMANLRPRINAETNSLSKKEPYYFMNDTEYILQAEYSGWKKTGARHMRENAIINWKLIVNNAAMNG